MAASRHVGFSYLQYIASGIEDQVLYEKKSNLVIQDAREMNLMEIKKYI